MNVDSSKETLDAKTRSIGFLLSQEFFFRVPEYQRPFSWETDNFDDLIDDIVNAPRDQEYFLGTIVLHHRKTEGYFDVVDGQQRLTSLLILMACLRDLITDSSYKTELQEKILQKERVVDGIPQKIRLEVKDRLIFKEIVVDDGGTGSDRKESDLPEPGRRYLNAVHVFRSKLAALRQDELQQISSFLSQKCVIIYLSTPVFEDAFKLFTIVNDRGKQLRRIDILKAINIAPDVITSVTVRNRVAQQWEDLENELGESTFEGIFHLVRLILLKDKPQGDLLKEFESRIFAKQAVAKGEPFLNLVFSYAQIYKVIFDDRDGVPVDEDETLHNKYVSLIHIMDSEFRASEWRACLLSFYKHFDGAGFYGFCLAMEKLYLTQWVASMRKDERYADYSSILALIESAKTPDEVLAGVPHNAESIRKAVGGPNLYTAGFGKYILLRLELVAAEHDHAREFRPKSVEHVLPQTPKATGYWADNHVLSEINEYVNTVGNLVLLSKSKNSSARNFNFSTKKDKYLAGRVSDYPRSVQVLQYEDWLRETIELRTKEAQALVLQDP